MPVPIPDAASCGFGVTTESLIASFVTPCALAPPFFDPALNGTTHTPPDPSYTKSNRPYAPASRLHCGLFIAAAVPMPVPAGGLPTPCAALLARARGMPATVVAHTTTSAATTSLRTRRRTVLVSTGMDSPPRTRAD